MSGSEHELETTYDRTFYETLDADVRASADAIVPVVLDLLHPASVLDVGCGRGTWLAAFARHGVSDIVGVDGPHIATAELEIPAAAFVAHDLSRPVRLGRRFDLVVSLEVAEHLDAGIAPAFVASLVAHAPVVLFSAAIPEQGGAGHVNEQWPSYWAARFAEHAYVPVDAVRPAVWTDERVAYWYAQNTLLYVDAGDPATEALRAGASEAGGEQPLDLVHPGMHLSRQATVSKSAPPSLSRALREVPRATARTVRRRLVRALPTDRRVKGLGGAKGRGRLQARRLAAPLLQRPVTLTTARGLKLRVSADPVDEHIAQGILGPKRSEYFPVWPGGAPVAPCILDIGAHHGLYAAAALHEYPGSRVVCVEPSADALPLLRTNLEINGFTSRARIAKVALAPEAGQGLLQHAPDGSWGYSLYEDAAAATGSEVVALATLAEILEDARPEIVKCNAEGAEYSLLEQLSRSDLRPAFMVVMVHPQFGDMARLVAQAEEMGYRVSDIGWSARPAFHMWRDPQAAP